MEALLAFQPWNKQNNVQSDQQPRRIAWPDPSPEMLDNPCFNAIWHTIKSWDINVPEAYSGYCGATGNHARAIYDALKDIPLSPVVSISLAGEREAITFERFSAANRARCESVDGFNHPLTSWSTSDWFLALFGELGEAANIAKKLNRARDGIPGNKQTPEALRIKLRQEIGDAFVYLDLLAQANGFSVINAATEVFNSKSVEIGYPLELV